MTENFLARLNELPENLANHVKITAVSLAAGICITIPLAIWLVRKKKLRYPILTGAGVIQTIPSLALLALMVPVLDATAGLGLGLAPFGFWPAIIALTLYSMLPILRNTVTGLLGVDEAVREAARGVGMSPSQVLLRVEFPLAAPVIIAGIRTATVWVVGIATLSTPVGQRSLGNFIFTGLQTTNWTMVMFGVVGAAVLAIVLDLLFAGVQKGLEERRRSLGFLSIACLLVAVVGGLFSPTLVQWARTAPADRLVTDDARRPGEMPPDQRPGRRTIRIGAKTFTEQYILASLISRVFEENGFETRQIESLGSTIAFEALRNGDIDVYVDYSGTIWSNYMNRQGTAPPWKVLAVVSGWLAQDQGIRCLGPLGFENAYTLAMRREQAEERQIDSIDDLAQHAPEMAIGGDYEFFGRPEWDGIREIYGLRFAEEISYDSTLMYPALAQGQVDVIAAFSSDGRIAAFDLITLEDPRNVIPPYDALLLQGPEISDQQDAVEAAMTIIGAIGDDMMRRANMMVDVQGESVDQAADWLFRQIGKSRGEWGGP